MSWPIAGRDAGMKTGPRSGTWWSRSWPCTARPPAARPTVTLAAHDPAPLVGRLVPERLGDSAAQAIVIGRAAACRPGTGPGPRPPRHPGHTRQPRRAYQAAGRTAEAIALHEQTLPPGNGSWARPPRHPDLAQQPRRRLPGRGPHRRGDRPARADPRRPGTGPGPRPPRHPDHARQPRHRLPGRGPHRRGDHLARAEPCRPGTRPGPRPPRHPEYARQPRPRLPGRRPHRQGKGGCMIKGPVLKLTDPEKESEPKGSGERFVVARTELPDLDGRHPENCVGSYFTHIGGSRSRCELRCVTTAQRSDRWQGGRRITWRRGDPEPAVTGYTVKYSRSMAICPSRTRKICTATPVRAARPDGRGPHRARDEYVRVRRLVQDQPGLPGVHRALGRQLPVKCAHACPDRITARQAARQPVTIRDQRSLVHSVLGEHRSHGTGIPADRAAYT